MPEDFMLKDAPLDDEEAKDEQFKAFVSALRSMYGKAIPVTPKS